MDPLKDFLRKTLKKRWGSETGQRGRALHCSVKVSSSIPLCATIPKQAAHPLQVALLSCSEILHA